MVVYFISLKVETLLNVILIVKINDFFFFSVPQVKIEGGPDIHAQAGSAVILKCSVIGALKKPTFVKW